MHYVKIIFGKYKNPQQTIENIFNGVTLQSAVNMNMIFFSIFVLIFDFLEYAEQTKYNQR